MPFYWQIPPVKADPIIVFDGYSKASRWRESPDNAIQSGFSPEVFLVDGSKQGGTTEQTLRP